MEKYLIIISNKDYENTVKDDKKQIKSMFFWNLCDASSCDLFLELIKEIIIKAIFYGNKMSNKKGQPILEWVPETTYQSIELTLYPYEYNDFKELTFVDFLSEVWWKILIGNTFINGSKRVALLTILFLITAFGYQINYDQELDYLKNWEDELFEIIKQHEINELSEKEQKLLINTWIQKNIICGTCKSNFETKMFSTNEQKQFIKDVLPKIWFQLINCKQICNTIDELSKL